jgi:serine/threonine protein kinase
MLETKATQRVDKYILGTLLGSGGTAEVWKAFDTSLQRYVAVKLLRTDRQADPDLIQRFRAEACAIASLNHPNIAQIYDLSPALISEESGGRAAFAYIVMPYIEGETLADFIARTSRVGRFPRSSEIARLFATIGRAVDYAHEREVVHCDIKPANILLDQRNVNYLPLGEPVLADFGLVKTLGTPVSEVLTHSAGSVVGTPLYIAPELIEGGSATRRSDLYSLGVVAYEMCTGRLPYEFPELPSGRHPISLVLQQVLFDPVPPSHFNARVTPRLEAVLLRAIARDPAERFPDAGTFSCALTQALTVPFEANADIGLKKGSVSPVSGSEVGAGRSTSGSQEAVPVRQSHARSEKGNRLRVRVPVLPHQGAYRSSAPSGSSLPLHARLLSPYGLIASALVSLLLIISTVFFVQGAMPESPHAASGPLPILGQVVFLNSGQGVTSENQGVNDEIAVSLSHLSLLPPGRSYYAWLEGDSDTSDTSTVLLGQLAVDREGNAHLANTNPQHAYIDSQHANLLTTMSRFLVTEEDSRVTPAFPSPDKTAWRYVGAVSQTPSRIDQDHFSLLDHLRHLLASDPTLDGIGLHGGLSLWLYRNAGMVQQFAQGAQRDYGTGDAANVHLELVRLLDYLDGINNVSGDIPAGTPVLVNRTYAQIGILQLHAYQNPPSYLYHVGLHLNGLVSSPGSTLSQQRLATLIVADLNTAGSLFQQVRSIASQLVSLTPAQLLQQQGVREQLSNLVSLATNAYQGKDGMLNGITWVHEQLENLAVMPVTVYQKP